MQKRHLDREMYFQEQIQTTEKFVIPYISTIMPVTPEIRVAEIGCGEGGNLVPFLDRGCRVVGIDLSDYRIALAEEYFADHPMRKNLTLINKNIYEVKDHTEYKFDLIIMRDTIEHIHNQEVFLDHLRKFLTPKGIVFFAFPPWRMPFGGHQQMCRGKWLSKLPYYHMLPKSLYRSVLKLGGEKEDMVEALLEIKDTGISINRFLNILEKKHFKIEKKTFYLINPNYETKFKLKPRELPAALNIPYLRDFFVTAMYCIVSAKD